MLNYLEKNHLKISAAKQNIRLQTAKCLKAFKEVSMILKLIPDQKKNQKQTEKNRVASAGMSGTDKYTLEAAF